jgi:hypothetical protein
MNPVTVTKLLRYSGIKTWLVLIHGSMLVQGTELLPSFLDPDGFEWIMSNRKNELSEAPGTELEAHSPLIYDTSTAWSDVRPVCSTVFQCQVSLLLYDPSEGIASFLGLVCSVSSLTWFF